MSEKVGKFQRVVYYDSWLFNRVINKMLAAGWVMTGDCGVTVDCDHVSWHWADLTHNDKSAVIYDSVGVPDVRR